MIRIRNKVVFVKCNSQWINLNLEKQTHGSLMNVLYNILKCKMGIHRYVKKFFMADLKSKSVCYYCNKKQKRKHNA